jgi:hypothetical protein
MHTTLGVCCPLPSHFEGSLSLARATQESQATSRDRGGPRRLGRQCSYCGWIVAETSLTGGRASAMSGNRSAVAANGSSVCGVTSSTAARVGRQARVTNEHLRRLEEARAATSDAGAEERVSSTRQGGTVRKLSARSGLVESPATATRASQPQRYLAAAMGVSFVLRAGTPPGREGRVAAADFSKAACVTVSTVASMSAAGSYGRRCTRRSSRSSSNGRTGVRDSQHSEARSRGRSRGGRHGDFLLIGSG